MARRNNENALKLAVADQPVAAAVEGYGQNFQLYGNVSFFLYKLMLSIIHYIIFSIYNRLKIY